MTEQVNREYAYVHNNMDVVPGYLFDKTSMEYFPRKYGKEIETVSIPLDFHIDIWNYEKISDEVNRIHKPTCTWQVDFTRANSKEVILVIGSKILEKKGVDTPLDQYMHTVSSVFYKSYHCMLIFFSKRPTAESLEEMKEYIYSVLYENKESFLPKETREHFNIAYIYQSYKQPGISKKYSKHAFEEFCLSLKNSKISTIPVEAVIESPKPNLPDAVRVSMNIDRESTVTVAPNSGIQNNLDSKRRIHSLDMRLEIAGTHLPSKCAKEESNSNRNVQSCAACNVLSASECIEMSCEHGKWQESGSDRVSMEGRETGMEYGSEKFCRDTDDLENFQAGETRTESGKGRGFGTRMVRGKPTAAALLSVGRVHQKNAEDSYMSGINCNLSRHTFGPGSQGINDFTSKSAHQSSQSNQIHNVQNQAHVSKVQECKKEYYEANDLNNMTDHNGKQIKFLKEAGKQEKLLGCSQPSVPSGNSTLRRDAQQAGHVTTVSITFSSPETKQQVHQTFGSQAETVSCTKEHFTNNTHCIKTSNIDKLEEIKKTRYINTGKSSQELESNEIDDLMQQNLREINLSEECSNTESKTFCKEVQTKVHHTEPRETEQIISTTTLNTDHKKVTRLDSGGGNNTEQDVGQQSPVQNSGESGCALFDSGLRGSFESWETKLHNENKWKSKGEKDNLKNAKHSRQSDSSYSSVVTRNDPLGNGSGNKKTKQSKSLQGSSNDDEMVDLKIKNNVSHTKHKHKSEKDRNMKTKLLIPVKVTKDACGLERKYFGIVNGTVPEKVLILLGASGSGKTTLLNFIANYFHGNKNADDELVHVECTSQTSSITAYTFCSSVEDIPITIIDTPGLNDSSGGEVRDHVQSLKTFLANAASKNVNVHALGFVAQAHLVRLTSSERLVMDYVSTMFGQNVSDHLITLVTFADTQDTPPVIEAMKNYKVNFKLFLKFNNSAWSNGKTDEVDDLDKVYYRVCWRNWKKCLKALKDSPPLSVNEMKAVQSEVYNTIVTESAEKDLKAEIAAFFRSYIKETFLSKENLKVCEQIWSLAAVVQRLKGAQMSSRTIEDILLEYAKETCKELRIPPESIVHTLALAPSRALTVVGTEIIQTMSRAYSIMKESESKSSSKYLIDISHCHGCNTEKEHRMKRTEFSWVKKTVAVGPEIICFKCEDCKCPGIVHGEQPAQPNYHVNKMLQLTVSRLRKALQSYSFSGFAVSEKIFLKHLRENLAVENKDFVDVLVKTMCK